ncbi:MAG: hypothetical protein JHC74_00135 [Thermoleophilia bacterium]|nr:hypothetical protein [Thermoleophilia bacterium]
MQLRPVAAACIALAVGGPASAAPPDFVLPVDGLDPGCTVRAYPAPFISGQVCTDHGVVPGRVSPRGQWTLRAAEGWRLMELQVTVRLDRRTLRAVTGSRSLRDGFIPCEGAAPSSGAMGDVIARATCRRLAWAVLLDGDGSGFRLTAAAPGPGLGPETVGGSIQVLGSASSATMRMTVRVCDGTIPIPRCLQRQVLHILRAKRPVVVRDLRDAQGRVWQPIRFGWPPLAA